MCHRKKEKFVEVGWSGTSICLGQKPLFSVQKFVFTKMIFGYDVIVTSRTPYDTHHGVVINRVKLDACTSSNFGRVKTDGQTERIALYMLDLPALQGRDPPSAMTGFSISVQPAVPTSRIGLLCEQ